MKRLLHLCCVCCLLTACQPQGIRFHRVDCLETALSMAQDEQKPLFLFVTSGKNDLTDVFQHDVFTQESLRSFFNEAFVSVSVSVESAGWKDLSTRYGLSQFPALLFLLPDGSLLTEITGLGAIGYDAFGQMPCLTPLMRYANLAADYLSQSDSVFFSEAHWKSLDMTFLRLDSKLFERIVFNQDLIKARFGEASYNMFIDYTLSAAAVSLLIKEKNQAPRRNEYRIRAYYDCLDRLDIDRKDRYRLYADVNIAYGMGQLEEARRAADEAFEKGAIAQHEYQQLIANFQ